MISRNEFINKYWAYYMMLEKKFINTLSYVTLSPQNFNTYSNEYASLLQLTGSELDVFFKEYCGFQLNDTKTIADYSQYILGSDPDIKTQQIEISNSAIVIQPFENWNASKAKQSLTWWSSYNDVKHNRVGNETKATLENVINVLGALFMLETKHLKVISQRDGVADRPDDMSLLFSLKNWEYNYMDGGEAFIKFTKMAIDELSDIK